MKSFKVEKWVKYYNLAIVISAIILIILAMATWRYNQDTTTVLGLIASPFRLIGNGLRTLSLSGSLGNIVSWVIYFLLGAIPLMIAYVLNKNGKKTSSVFLMMIIAIFTYLLIYANINPGILTSFQSSYLPNSSGQVEVVLIILAMVFYYLLFSFFIVLMLDSVETKAIISNLSFLFIFIIAITMIGIFYLGFHELISGFTLSPNYGNVIYATRPSGDNFLSLVKFTVVFVPGLFFIRTGKAALVLMSQLNRDFHTMENALLAKEVGDYAKKTVVAYITATLIFVFIQLILAPILTDVAVVLSLPVLELFLSFSMVLLSRFLIDSSELKKENESFI